MTGDEVTGRSADAKKKTVAKPNNSKDKAKQVNKSQPTKVQETVKAPCQEAIEKAVAATMTAHIKVSLSSSNSILLIKDKNDNSILTKN
jgi:hypothetical protein